MTNLLSDELKVIYEDLTNLRFDERRFSASFGFHVDTVEAIYERSNFQSYGGAAKDLLMFLHFTKDYSADANVFFKTNEKTFYQTCWNVASYLFYHLRTVFLLLHLLY